MNSKIKRYHSYKNILLLTAFYAVLTNAVYAKQATPEDQYENKAVINIDGRKSLQKMVLPESVQSKLHSTNADDIRVYNDEGMAVPMLIKYERSVAARDIIKNIVFYPVRSSNGDLSFNGKVENENTSDLEINIALRLNKIKQPKSSDPADTAPKMYILENPQYVNGQKDNNLVNSKLYQLQLNWANNFEGIAGYTVDTSADLNHWKKITTNNIADMRFMNQHLSKNTIEIHGKVERFIRITWKSDKYPDISEIQAKFRAQAVAPVFEWSEAIELVPVENISEGNNAYDVRVSPSYKSDRIRFVTAPGNQVYSGIILAGLDKRQWHRFADFRFYNVTVNADVVSVLEKAINPRAYENWRLRFRYPKSLNIHEHVKLQVSRYPATLYFLNQGSGPFYLYYGKKNSRAQDSSVSNIVADLYTKVADETGVARLGMAEMIMHEERETTDTGTLKKYILWGVMVAGVILMLLMARGLFRQMQEAD